jgi:hypothetical protein
VRRTAAALCLVLACVLPAVAVASWWAYGNATDTEKFTETARPLATDETVQAAVVDELVRVAGARLSALPVGADAARARVRTLAEQTVQTSAYRAAWRRVQRSAHQRLATRLTGATSTPVTLDLGPIATVLRARVRSATGLEQVADAIVDPQPVTVLDRSEVRRAQQATDRLRIVRGVALPAAVAALLGVLITAPLLSRGVLRVGLCLGVSTLLLVGGIALGRTAIVSGGQAGDLRLAVYDVLTDPLHAWITGGVIAAAVLVLLGGGLIALGWNGSERDRRDPRDRSRRAPPGGRYPAP